MNLVICDSFASLVANLQTKPLRYLFRWPVIQRQDAAKPLGDPPMGVRVVAGMMAPDRPYEDRIVYSRRKLSGVLIGLWPLAELA